MPPVTPHRPEFDRRTALKLLGAGAAMAMTRCSPPDEEIVPYVEMPEGLVAGEPIRFATTLSLSGFGRGFLAISVDGRPIKIEGNPRHPYSLGATDIFAESEVLSLYDPNRTKVPRRHERIATWDAFSQEWSRIADSVADRSIGLVTGRVVAPTTLARIEKLRQIFPALRWYRYEPVNDDAARAGAKLAFGQVVIARPRLAEADVVLALDADPLGHGPEELRLAREFASRRQANNRQRLHVVEPAWTLTGAAADFRLALAPQSIAEVARVVAGTIGHEVGEPKLDDATRGVSEEAARQLIGARGRALVLAGEGQPPELHALCHWINARLNAPVDYLPSPDPVEAAHSAELLALAKDLGAGRIGALIVVDANPVYDAPDRLGLADAIKAVPFTVHFGLYRDETAACCQWHLPSSHTLESWGDARAPDGTASLVQPLIKRLYDTRTRDELLAILANEPQRGAYELTQATWQKQAAGDFDTWWRTALLDGVIAGSASSPLSLPEPKAVDLPATPPAKNVTLVLSPHSSVWDGRFAANVWLQECPSAFTKQVWGNCLQLSPADAARLGVEDEDTIEIEIGTTTVRLPAIVMPGQAEGVVAAEWGQGHGPGLGIGTAVGERFFGAAATPFARLMDGVRLRRSSDQVPFRSTQRHTRLHGRADELFQIATAAEATGPAGEPEPRPPSLLPHPERGDYAWAMVVDTDACIGCNACVVACQAENNVPVVGPEEVALGRDMHWLRVDSYALPHGGRTLRGFQPVPCMHCELAPCEPVCPVEASIHDRQGLNVQVYNRCIGTRFCEANCPYKVRRFNWFAYADGQAYGNTKLALKAQHNPDVSARDRGVMEKCNYCLQRISRARRTAEKEDRRVAEGEMVTACQAACPTRAIHFGDLNRPDSDVANLRHGARHYTLLEKLNTRPRTTYLKRIAPPGEGSA